MGEKNAIIFGRKEETVFFIFGRKEDVGKKRKVIFGRKELRPCTGSTSVSTLHGGLCILWVLTHFTDVLFRLGAQRLSTFDVV
jgi:hypothetical protein